MGRVDNLTQLNYWMTARVRKMKHYERIGNIFLEQLNTIKKWILNQNAAIDTWWRNSTLPTTEKDGNAQPTNALYSDIVFHKVSVVDQQCYHSIPRCRSLNLTWASEHRHGILRRCCLASQHAASPYWLNYKLWGYGSKRWAVCYNLVVPVE